MVYVIVYYVLYIFYLKGKVGRVKSKKKEIVNRSYSNVLNVLVLIFREIDL